LVWVVGLFVVVFGATTQTFTHRGGGVFTADGITGDRRLAFTPGPAGAMRVEYLSEGVVGDAAERMAESAVWRPDATVLAEYAGTYASEELNAVWRLAARNGQLVLRRPGRMDGPLLPFQPDVFSRHFGVWNEPLIASFAFARDSAGRITHFAITTPPGEDVVRDLLSSGCRCIEPRSAV
jgi:hypothetical protein